MSAAKEDRLALLEQLLALSTRQLVLASDSGALDRVEAIFARKAALLGRLEQAAAVPAESAAAYERIGRAILENDAALEMQLLAAREATRREIAELGRQTQLKHYLRRGPNARRSIMR